MTHSFVNITEALLKKRHKPLSVILIYFFISLETLEKLNQKEQQFALMSSELDQLRSNLTGKGKAKF